MESSSHILEELRSLRGAHVDLMSKMSDVCGEMRGLVLELRHTQANFADVTQRVADVEKQMREVQIENATNRPILEIARNMYRAQWVTIISAVGAVAGTNADKLLGG